MTSDLALPDPDLSQAPFTWKTLVAISKTEFVPKGLRGRPDAVLACVLTGRELGLGPMESLRSIDMIEGKPSPSGEWMVSRIFEAGHTIETKEQSDTTCTVYGQRRNADGKTVATMEFTYTIEMAKRAGLTGKDNWKKYPEAMLYWRAVSQLARQFFADCLHGLKHLSEELGGEDYEPIVDFPPIDGGDPDEFEVSVPTEVETRASGASETSQDLPEQHIEPAVVPGARTPKQRATDDAFLIDDDELYDKLTELLDGNPADGTREDIEHRVRILYRLMYRAGLWKEGAFHDAIRKVVDAEPGDEVHWGTLGVKEKMISMATKSWMAAKDAMN